MDSRTFRTTRRTRGLRMRTWLGLGFGLGLGLGLRLGLGLGLGLELGAADAHEQRDYARPRAHDDHDLRGVAEA